MEKVQARIELLEPQIQAAGKSFLSALQSGNQSLAEYWLKEKERLQKKEEQLWEEKLFLLKCNVPHEIGGYGPSFALPELTSSDMASLDCFLEGKAGIPRYRDTNIPRFGDRPSLLLHGLLAHDTENFDKFVSRGSRFLLVPGTSGAGKTRTLYAHLAKNFGFYFISNDLGNGGSADLREVIGILATYLGADQVKNYTITTFMVTVLLLVRIVVFLYCKGKDITPEKWLMLQVGCQRLEQDMKPLKLDPFAACTRLALGRYGPVLHGSLVGIAGLLGQAKNALSKLLGGQQLPLLVVDEAQELVKLYAGQFRTNIEPFKDRPLAKPVLETLLYPGNESPIHHVVYAGTGFLLSFSRLEFNNSVGKPFVKDDVYEGLGSWTDWKQMAAYSCCILGTAWDAEAQETVKNEIFPYFRGRFRPFATLLEEVIRRGKHIRWVWNDVFIGLTARQGIPGIQKSYYRILAEVASGRRGLLGEVDIHFFVDLLLKVTVQYFYFGWSFTCPVYGDEQENDLPLTLLEVAIGRVYGKQMVIIDEPLMLVAMHNYFLDEKKITGNMLDTLYALNNPSTGNWWEHLFPLEIKDLWEKHEGKLDQFELFHDLDLTQNLEALKSKKSRIMEGSIFYLDGAPMPPVVIYKANKNYTCHDYLASDVPGCMFLVAEHAAGCDLMFRIQFEDHTIVWVSVQLKLRKILPNAYDAVCKAEPSPKYTCRGEMLCLLVAYPASVNHPPVEKQKIDGQTRSVVTVDRKNAHKFISLDHLKNLDILKVEERMIF
ncbi:uncharacterized protein LOC9661643 isoform X2 [Selaginella moellendorffii]|uniref:uncharacterized protein LOC9661643 isoform X2 n=1 Tax=Selaginella moellendorffii TaxID=88036 RepID=UPI000D1C4B95|nr:uncharacterized protein LOC9661643 isoform X2 [Selaginella moellendorffii]|eukprot:XP_024518975.1 uncharacterized protein LOC9661643 isoform X2 [Selaginella moellendorffii]